MAIKGIKDIKDWVIGNDPDDKLDGEYPSDEFTESSTSIFENTSVDTARFGNDEFAKKSSQMVVFEPRSYSESQGIADHLKSGRGCIINLHRVSKDQAKRIIDFLSGVVYAIEGEVQKIGANVFLCTPANFGVYGEISESEE